MVMDSGQDFCGMDQVKLLINLHGWVYLDSLSIEIMKVMLPNKEIELLLFG